MTAFKIIAFGIFIIIALYIIGSFPALTVAFVALGMAFLFFVFGKE